MVLEVSRKLWGMQDGFTSWDHQFEARLETASHMAQPWSTILLLVVGQGSR